MKTELEKIQEEYKALGEKIKALKNEKQKFQPYKWIGYKPKLDTHITAIIRTSDRPDKHCTGLDLIGEWTDSFCSFENMDKTRIFDISPQEVEQHLIAKAKKRGLKGAANTKDVVKFKNTLIEKKVKRYNGCTEFPYKSVNGDTGSSFEYDLTTDSLITTGRGFFVIYQQGKWAEIVKD